MSSTEQTHPEKPPTVYRERTASLKARERTLQRQHILLGYLRLALGIAVIVLLLPPRLWALLPLCAFAIAARIHGGILSRLAATRRTLTFYEHALARLEERWADLPLRTTRVDTTQSLYAADLDLFGPASLFNLLCEARTSLGEDTLAAQLLAPARLPELRERQSAVTDLRTRLPLREAFAAAPGPAVATLDRTALTTWAERSESAPPLWLRWLAPLLVILFAIATWQSIRLHLLLPITAILIINGAITFFCRRSFTSLFAEAQTAHRALKTIPALLASIEAETFTAPHLQRLQTKLRGPAGSAAHAIGRLASISQWIDARANYLIRILDAPLLYSLQLALFVRNWKRRYGAHIGAWLEALGDFEALLSLGAYSYEHPEDPFPQFTEGPATFRAGGLGHPLLPTATCVRNDVTLGNPAQILLVSGSNMSGKSTLLRSIGINTVLAFAGAPVRAHSLSLSPLTLAASIHINDSLQAGRSRFYAEIIRLRAITKAAHTQSPVLFLIDELLGGTNSRDRLAGAQGLVRELAGTGAIGILSTHDLALTALAGSGSQPIENMHFEDSIQDGKLHFDYKLREGILKRSNGLALMRLIGLKV